MATTADRPPTAHALPPGIHAHPTLFTGSGREYFRVWIVNVLLSIVTLGLYTPWARRRTAQYFYSHTQVAGSPLEFVAEQRRMVFGFLAFAGLYLSYQLAVETGQQLAASLLMFGFALLAPFLWASAMRFRLGATRWRGIRLAFTATWKEVYIASWPAFAIAALWTALFFAAAALSPAMPTGIAEQPGSVTPLPALGRATLGLMALGAVLTLLCVIRLEFNYRRLLVARARIGGQVGHWKPRYADFVRVWLATAGFFLLTVLLLALAGAAVTGGSAAVLRRTMGDAGSLGGMLLLAITGAPRAAIPLFNFHQPCHQSVKEGCHAAVYTFLSLPITNASSLLLLLDTAFTGAPAFALPLLSVHQPCHQSVNAGSHAAVRIEPFLSVTNMSSLLALLDTTPICVLGKSLGLCNVGQPICALVYLQICKEF